LAATQKLIKNDARREERKKRKQKAVGAVDYYRLALAPRDNIARVVYMYIPAPRSSRRRVAQCIYLAYADRPLIRLKLIHSDCEPDAAPTEVWTPTAALALLLTQHLLFLFFSPPSSPPVSISATAGCDFFSIVRVFAGRRFFLFASRRDVLSLSLPTTIAPLYVRAMRGVWLPSNLNIAAQAEEEEYAVRRGRSKEERMVDGMCKTYQRAQRRVEVK